MGEIAADLQAVIDAVMLKPSRAANRLVALADFAIKQLDHFGLPNVKGGSKGELRVSGLARQKRWDVAHEFAGKYRLLISLKSMWKNVAGTVPNRLDDLMGEVANVQQFSPEIVVGYIVVFDSALDRERKDTIRWSNFFEDALKRIAIRKAPLWNQGLLEGSWFIRVDSERAPGLRVVDPDKAEREGEKFFKALIDELRLREPAIPFKTPST